MNYENLLLEKYGTAILTADQVSEVTTRSVHSLTVDRRNGTGISYKRTGNSDNSPVRYAIHEVSKWLNQSMKVV